MFPQEPDDHRVDLATLARRYSTDPEVGLTWAQADDNLRRFGANALPASTPRSNLARIRKQFFGGYSIVYWIAVGVSFAVFGLSVHHGMTGAWAYLSLSLSVLAGLLFTSVLGYCKDYATSAFLEGLQSPVLDAKPLFDVVRDGVAAKTHWRDLAVGDLLFLRPGDRIPADVRIIEASQFKVDNASVTGRSAALLRSTNATSDDPAESENMVFLTNVVLEGEARGIVIRTGERTVAGSVAKELLGLGAGEVKTSVELRRFAFAITFVALSLGAVALFVALLTGEPFLHALVVMLCVVVIVLPEGQVAALTIVHATGAKTLAHRNGVLKNVEALEALGATSVVCTDKTGTITHNRMRVAHVWVDGVLRPAEVFALDPAVRSPTRDDLLLCSVLCSNVRYVNTKGALRRTLSLCGDPLEVALYEMAERALDEDPNFLQEVHPKVFQMAYTPEKRFQLSVHRIPVGDLLVVAMGAPEVVIARCSSIVMGGEVRPLADQRVADCHAACRTFSENGEKVVCLAKCVIPADEAKAAADRGDALPTKTFQLLGLVSMVDPPRSKVSSTIRTCQASGLRVVMMTGDYPLLAETVGRGVGILRDASETADKVAARLNAPLTSMSPFDHAGIVVHGDQLREMSDEDLEKVLAFRDIVFARVTPWQKLRIVSAFQKQGECVAAVGDGINDALALRKANTGIVMGYSGSDVAVQASDVILLDNNFATLEYAIKSGRRVHDNLKKILVYLLSSHLPALAPFALHVALGLPRPVGLIPAVIFDLLTGVLPGITLAYESPETEGIMEKAERKRNSLFGWPMFFRSFFQIGVLELAAGMSVYFTAYQLSGFPISLLLFSRQRWEDQFLEFQDAHGQEWSYEARYALEISVSSAYFYAVILSQMANLLTCKTRKASLFEQGLMNCKLNAALVACLAVGGFIATVTEAATGMRKPDFLWVLAAVPWLVLLLVFEELKKYLIRRYPGTWIEDHFLW